jgi:tetratricopeptide (TPR) repeat protein
MFRALMAAGLLACPAAVSRAHDSPEHVLDAINKVMASEGATATHHLQRAMVYRQLNLLDEATADLHAALRMEPGLPGVGVQLSRVYLDQGKTAAALMAINVAIEQEKREWARAPLHAARADVRVAMDDPTEALADCEQALAFSPLDVNLYLKRSELQQRLGQPADARADGLREGHQRTSSAVLLTEWVEAMIDAGKYADVLPTVESQLADSRWKSSWLLRRARCRMGLGQGDAGRADLLAAVEELTGRLAPDLPDPSLLADRGLARALLGDLDAARDDAIKAKEAGAEPWMLRRLDAALATPND